MKPHTKFKNALFSKAAPKHVKITSNWIHSLNFMLTSVILSFVAYIAAKEPHFRTVVIWCKFIVAG
jgi:hypothetical protein